MDAPAARPFVPMENVVLRNSQTLFASPTELVLPKTAEAPATVNASSSSTYTPPFGPQLPEISPPFISNAPSTHTPPARVPARLPRIAPPFIVNAPSRYTLTPPACWSESLPEISPAFIVIVPPP